MSVRISAFPARGPYWLITCAAIAPPSLPAVFRSRPLRVRVQEPGGIGIAGAGGIHDLDTLDRVDDVDLVAIDHDRTLLAARQRRDLAVLAHLLQGVVEVFGLVERQDLAFIGEQDVHVLLGQIEELVAKARHAE